MKTKRKVNRLMSSVLVLLMIVGIVPMMSVSAETYPDFKYEIVDEEVTITGRSIYNHEMELSIPSEIEGYPVTSIGDYAFLGDDFLYKITFPDTVTNIGEHAFEGCTMLEGITLPEGVTNIGAEAFRDCIGLVDIAVNENNPVYDSRNDCDAIIETETNTLIWACSNTIIPYGVTSIGAYAFSSYSDTSAIEVPYSVTSIGDFAFSGCTAEYIYLDIQVESIGGFAFEHCTNLKDMVLPDAVKNIGDAAFVDCSSLETVEIFSDNIESFGQEMFVRCSSLRSVVLPEGITSIGPYMFSCCESLETIITEDMFYDMESLETGTVVLPDSVKSIGELAVDSCTSLKNITIPAGVTSIGVSAFYNCTSLTDVYFEGTQEQWEQIEFGAYVEDDLANATIHFAEPVAEVTGNSITLEGDIGVNFFIKVKDDVLADEDATVIFTYDDSVVEVPVSDGTETENGYKYTCNIPAKDMTTEVTCKVKTAEGDSAEYVYTVKDYAQTILANPDTYGEAAVSLVKAMLNYGTAAQKYFNYNKDNLANDTEYMTDEDRAVPAKDFSDLSYTLTEGAGEVVYYGSSLTLKSQVGIKHYFIIADTVELDKLTVTVDGNNAELIKNGDLYQLNITDIAANNLYKDFAVQVGDVSLSYCAMDYGAAAQKAYSKSLIEIMSALDAYAQCAMAYEN